VIRFLLLLVTLFGSCVSVPAYFALADAWQHHIKPRVNRHRAARRFTP
jgi:uncharacterized membrane protein YozB (DUF420 family)